MNGLGGPLLWAQQMGPGALDGGLPPGTTGYGAALLRSIVALAVVCIAAWVSLRWAAKRGIALGASAKGGRVRVLERVALDAPTTAGIVLTAGLAVLGVRLLDPTPERDGTTVGRY